MSGEMETVSATGNVHPGFCWSQWDGAALECRECRIAEKCSDATKRMTSKASVVKPVEPVSAPKPTSKPTPKPAPKVEPEPAPKVEPAAPETPEAMLVRVVNATTKGVHTVEDKGMFLLFYFLNPNREKVLSCFFAKASSNAKLINRKNEAQLLSAGFTEKDVTAAMNSLL